MRSTKIVFDDRTRTLELESSDLPAPEPGGVVARVTMAGVCGTDAHRLAGHVPGDGQRVTFGHEAVGVAVEVGAGARDWSGNLLAEGDRIVWFPASAGCGECAECLDEMWILCSRERWPYPAHLSSPAGFQEYATLSPRVPVYRCDDAASDEAYTAFGCALPTAVEGLDVIGGVRRTDSVVVQGAGPVGLAYAALVAGESPARLIVIGTPPSRLSWATRFGATTALDIAATTPAERLAAVRELTEGRGADLVVEATGVPEAFPEGLDLLARRGRYLITGLWSGSRTVAVDPVLINNKLLTIRGAYGGLPRHRQRAVELVPELQARYGIASLVESTFPLAETERAILHLGRGVATKSAVVP